MGYTCHSDGLKIWVPEDTNLAHNTDKARLYSFSKLQNKESRSPRRKTLCLQLATLLLSLQFLHSRTLPPLHSSFTVQAAHTPKQILNTLGSETLGASMISQVKNSVLTSCDMPQSKHRHTHNRAPNYSRLCGQCLQSMKQSRVNTWDPSSRQLSICKSSLKSQELLSQTLEQFQFTALGTRSSVNPTSIQAVWVHRS